jgi:hypothetical protein
MGPQAGSLLRTPPTWGLNPESKPMDCGSTIGGSAVASFLSRVQILYGAYVCDLAFTFTNMFDLMLHRESSKR